MFRRACLGLIAALLPLVLLFGAPGNIASGLQATMIEARANSSAASFASHPLPQRNAATSGWNDWADEEDAPERTYRSNAIVAWPPQVASCVRAERASDVVDGAPAACAAQPRAPPTF